MIVWYSNFSSTPLDFRFAESNILDTGLASVVPILGLAPEHRNDVSVTASSLIAAMEKGFALDTL